MSILEHSMHNSRYSPRNYIIFKNVFQGILDPRTVIGITLKKKKKTSRSNV